MAEVGYGVLPIVPSLKGAGAIISRELEAQTKTSGVAAGRRLGAGMSKGAASQMKTGGLFSNIEKGAAVSGVGAGKRFGSALHETVGEYAKATGAAMVGFLAFEKVKELLGETISEGREAQAAQRLTASTIKATGGAAGLSAEQIDKMSASIGEAAGRDDDYVHSGANLLLTFRNIKEGATGTSKIFSETLADAMDVSAAKGTELRATVLQLGKAVNDPVKGMSALTRIGITFTAQQQAQIKALATSGHMLEAQRLVLKNVEGSYKGAADAMATPMQRAQAKVKDLEEELGLKLLPTLDKLAVVGAGGLTKTVSVVSQIPGPVKEMAAAFLAVKAADSVGLFKATSSAMTTMRLRTMLAGEAVLNFRTDLGAMRSGLGATAEEQAAYSASATRLRTSLLGIGKGVAVLGGLALATSGTSDKLGVTNTVALALAGSMAGPVGTGVGAAAGAFLDAQKAASGLESQLKSVTQSDDATTLTKGLAALEAQRKDLNHSTGLGDAFKDDMTELGALFHGHGSALTNNSFLDKAIDSTKTKLAGLTGTQRTAAAVEGAYGTTVQKATKAELAQAKALDASRKSARGTAQSFTALTKDTDNAKVSLDAWIAQQRAQATALQNFTANLETAAHRGLRDGLIKQLEAAGPTGALRMAQLAHATKSQIAAANQSWAAGQRAVKHYTDVVGGVPKRAGTTLEITGADVALQILARIKAATATVPRSVSTEYYVTQVNAQNKRGGHAIGGLITGPGTSTSDSIPTMLSNHEYVEKASAVSKYGRSFMDAVNSGTYDPSTYLPAAPRAAAAQQTVHHVVHVVQHPYTGPVALDMGEGITMTALMRAIAQDEQDPNL